MILTDLKVICDYTSLTAKCGYSGKDKVWWAKLVNTDHNNREICSGIGSSPRDSLTMLLNVFNDHHANEFNKSKKNQ